MNTRILLAAVVCGLAPLASAQDAAPAAAGEVALVTGVVTLAAEPPVVLKAGDKIREGQTLNVGANSYASLKFADGGRVLLRPGTEFTVESYKYEAPVALAPAAGTPAAPASAVGTAFFRLVRGGFRAISGLIGKGDQQAYKVTTPVATIGIRGTDYEVELCEGDCPAQAQASAAGTMLAASAQLAQADVPPQPATGGVILATHEGSIEATTAGGATFRVDAGQVGVMLASGQTFMLPAVPDALLINPAPNPEGCQ